MPFGFIVMQLVFFALPVGAVAFFGWLGLRYVRARERDVGARLKAESSGRADELARLRDAMLELRSDVHGLRERQEFVERLLESPRSGDCAGAGSDTTTRTPGRSQS